MEFRFLVTTECRSLNQRREEDTERQKVQCKGERSDGCITCKLLLRCKRRTWKEDAEEGDGALGRNTMTDELKEEGGGGWEGATLARKG